MKKITLLLSVFALVLTSCSDNDDTPTANPTTSNSDVLIKKRIFTETGFPAETTTYTYNGKKLVKATSDLYGYTNFTYTGDLITKVEDYSTSNELELSKVYTYNSSDKLLTVTYKDFISNDGMKFVFTYNAGGTVSYDEYIGDVTSQPDFNGSYKMFFQNNEVIKLEQYSPTGVLQQTRTYTYDGKNNPYKNIIGWAQLQYDHYHLGGAFQNAINRNVPGFMTTNFDTYDSNNFLLTQTFKRNSDSSVISTTQCIY